MAAAQKPCRSQPCPNRQAEQGLCVQHLAEKRSRYDRERRPGRHGFYDTAVWKRARLKKLADQPICVKCDKELATDVDHIIPLEDAPDRALDQTNLQGLCHACHAQKTAAENKAKGKW